MTLQSFGKHIKHESEEGTNNQESKKRQRGSYIQWFAPHLWHHIHITMEKHRRLIIALHYLHAFHRNM
jgi:hypothetical protein